VPRAVGPKFKVVGGTAEGGEGGPALGCAREIGDRFEMGSALRPLGAGMAAAMVLCLAPAVPTAGATPVGHRTVVSRSQEWGATEEQAFVDKINLLRSSLGLATLTVDAELTTQARIWAQTMKDAGNIFHSGDLAGGITSDWEKLGENVGVGGTVDALFDAFVASPKHYENLVDPTYRFVGIGVVWDGSRMFTTHRFMALMPPAPTTTAPTRRPASPPTTEAVSAAPPDELAATDPAAPAAPAAAAPAAPPRPAIPPARPARVALVLSTIDDLLD